MFSARRISSRHGAPRVAVVADLTTLLRVQVDSVFASLDTLRRKSDVPTESGWIGSGCYVLQRLPRTILQWQDADQDFATSAQRTDLPHQQGFSMD